MSAALRIDGEFGICRAAELKPRLLAALERDGGLALDLSGVTELDSAGVQLMLLARQEAAARQLPMRVTAASAAVRRTLALLNLERRFDGLPSHSTEHPHES